MEIHLEQRSQHSIQAYSEIEIQVNSIRYKRNIIVSRHKIIEEWPLDSIQALTPLTLKPLTDLHPEIILLGHGSPGTHAPIGIMQLLSERRIGLESMSIGAACRTYNVLLNEERAVVLGLILS